MVLELVRNRQTVMKPDFPGAKQKIESLLRAHQVHLSLASPKVYMIAPFPLKNTSSRGPKLTMDLSLVSASSLPSEENQTGGQKGRQSSDTPQI
jgi:hypothetical protein